MEPRLSSRRATRAARWVMIVALAATSTACNMTPTYERPQQNIPTTYRHQNPEPAPGLPKPQSNWWTVFGSEELDTLVEEALANNHDVKAAAARIVQAETLAGSAASALLPTITSSFKRSTDSPQGGQGADPSSTTNRTHRVWSAYTSASWEVDLWGKIRASEASSLATALADVHDREAVALALVADVVLSYMQYLEGMDREAVARSNIANMESMYKAVSERVRLGESSKLELAQQRNVLAQAKATIPPILLTRERAFDKLAVLLGRPPESLALSGQTLRDLLVPDVSSGLPSDLLLRRPDIRKAEANLVAANANVGVARAKLFPTLSFSGDRGWAAWYLDQITKPTSIFFTIAGTVTATIFDNGKTRADIQYAEAKKEELVETYQQTILTSLRDVEDSLTAVRSQNDLEVAQQEVLQASLDAYGLSAEAFRLGLVDYLNVLETQRTRFQAEDAKVQARYGRFEAVIGLYKALGGGVQDDGEATQAGTKAEEKTTASPPPPQATTTTTTSGESAGAPLQNNAPPQTVQEPEAPTPAAQPRAPVASEPAPAKAPAAVAPAPAKVSEPAPVKAPEPAASAAPSPSEWPSHVVEQMQPQAAPAPKAEAPAPVAAPAPAPAAAPASAAAKAETSAPSSWPSYVIDQMNTQAPAAAAAAAAAPAPKATAAPTPEAAPNSTSWPSYVIDQMTPQSAVKAAPAGSATAPATRAPTSVAPAEIYPRNYDVNAN